MDPSTLGVRPPTVTPVPVNRRPLDPEERLPLGKGRLLLYRASRDLGTMEVATVAVSRRRRRPIKRKPSSYLRIWCKNVV